MLPDARVPWRQHGRHFQDCRHECRPHLSLLRDKEAIIDAIVEQDIADIATLFEEISREGDILGAMIARADHGCEVHTDHSAAALFHEITAEAARNPKVAAIVHRADRIKREVVIDLIRKGRAARGLSTSEEELDGRLEILAAIFEGLSARAIRSPSMNRAATLKVLQDVMRHLLEE
jgi:AcrR family transcriptional regulator